MKLTASAAAIFTLAIATASAAEKLGGYAGADAGRLVVSISISNDMAGEAYNLCYRALGGGGTGAFKYDSASLIQYAGDFREPPIDPRIRPPIDAPQFAIRYSDQPFVGAVRVARLAPGDYEFYHFGRERCEPARPDLAIRFRIEPGKAAYLGEFKTIGVWGVPADSRAPAFGAYRVVLSDQSGRDLPYAQRRDPAIRALAPMVSEGEKVGSSFFASRP
jgi:hypothetical protein